MPGDSGRPKGSQDADLQQDAVTLALLVTAVPGVPVPVDVTDRWARLLGQVDIARANGAAMAPANPLIAGIYDIAGNRMPAMDAVARPGYVDPIDRAARLLGVTYGSRAQQLQQKATTFELLVEDTGLHTNPRRYESDYGFVSSPIAVVGPAATAVWAVGVACVRNPSGVPANGRTAGGITTVYTMELRNPNAAAQTAWLETTAGVVVSVVYEIAAADTLIVDFVAGKTFGNMDLYVNGSIAAIECQLEGTEV